MFWILGWIKEFERKKTLNKNIDKVTKRLCCFVGNLINVFRYGQISKLRISHDM